MAGKISITQLPSGVYRVRFTAPDFRRVQKSARTTDRRQAEEFAARLYAEHWRVHQLGERPRRRWEDAVIRWLGDRSAKRSIGKDRANLRWLDQHLAGRYLDSITPDVLHSITQARLRAPMSERLTKTSPATVNRMLALVRSILRACVDWQWIDAAPSVSMLKEKREAWRWLTRDEAARLIAALPDHLRAPAVFSLATGLREQNALRLEWSRVDLGRRVAWIFGEDVKTGNALSVALNADAVACLRGQVGKHHRWCFPGPNGDPLARANNHGWRTAIVRAGVAPLRWHDLRHTWASWHIQAGTPLEVLMQLGGWKSLSIVMRYAHLAPSHVAPHAEAITGRGLVAANVVRLVK